jgi:hypothetical protein
MKPKVWIWTVVLSFLGYSLAGKGAITNGWHEAIGLLLGAILGFSIGWAMQLHDEAQAP